MVDTGTLGWLIPLAMLGVASMLALVARVVDRRRPRRRPMKGLGPSVMLFTSQRCPGCDPVRSRLIEVLGIEGFREIRWAEEPQIFATHKIHRVPTAAAVGENGDALVWEGMPSVRLLRRWKSLVPR